MKVVFIVLSIAMTSQVTLAGVRGRFKRDPSVDGIEALLNLNNHLAACTGPLVKLVLEEIPKTVAYAKYREDLEEFLEAYSTYKSKKGICFKKSGDLLEKFGSIIEEYDREDAPAEAKKVYEIFNRFESEDLEKEIVEVGKKLEAINDTDDSTDVDEEAEGIKVFSMLFQVC